MLSKLSSDLIFFFFLFNSLYSQFVQFGHLEEFFNCLIITWVTTFSGVPSSRLLGYVLCDVCWVFPFQSMFQVLIASAVSQFGCVAILSLYFSAYLLISSLGVDIPRSLVCPCFSILFIWLIAAVPHSGIPYVQIGFMIDLILELNMCPFIFCKICKILFFIILEY